METTERFDRAVKVLYKAFHAGELNSNNCKSCAVGNILGHNHWMGGSVEEYCVNGLSPLQAINTFTKPNNSGYTVVELAMVEYLFIMGIHGDKDKEWIKAKCYFGECPETPDEHFKGLCAVVEYLAKLDNIPNPMDYTKLFEQTEAGKPKYELV